MSITLPFPAATPRLVVGATIGGRGAAIAVQIRYVFDSLAQPAKIEKHAIDGLGDPAWVPIGAAHDAVPDSASILALVLAKILAATSRIETHEDVGRELERVCRGNDRGVVVELGRL